VLPSWVSSPYRLAVLSCPEEVDSSVSQARLSQPELVLEREPVSQPEEE